MVMMRRFYSRHFLEPTIYGQYYISGQNKRRRYTKNNTTKKEIFVQKDFSKFSSEADENLNIEVIGDMV